MPNLNDRQDIGFSRKEFNFDDRVKCYEEVLCSVRSSLQSIEDLNVGLICSNKNKI